MAEENELGTFDKLVSSLSDSERKVLLDKMHSLVGDPSTQELESDDRDEGISFSIEDKLKNESIFYRLFVWIRSVFSNSSKEDVYNQDQVVVLFKRINHSFPGLIDYKNGYLLGIFYQKLGELKKAVDFFRPYLEFAYENLGAYYLFLGSIICPEVTQEMDMQVDPYTIPFSREVTGELRSSLLRKMDEIIKNIPTSSRSYMYSCATTVEWFYQLSRLPFDRFKNSFTQGILDSYSCKFEICSSELNAFAQVLCNGGSVPETAITSLYLYSANKFIPADSEAKDDEGRMKEYMNKATANISMIHMFIKTVPLRQIARIAFNNVQWVPENFRGAEDWFIKYKEQWKKLFDQKWEAWLRDKKKAVINSQLTNVFELENFPLLPNRPWTQIWEGVPFHFEYTTGFIFWFMHNRYDDSIQPLKLLLLEGVFENKDNRQEFANTLNDITQVYNDIHQLDEDLSPVGQIGLVFDKIIANHLRTLQAQSKIESTMLTVESKAQSIKKNFCQDCRSIEKIVDAALGSKEDTRYDGISNINKIKDFKGKTFKQAIKDSRDLFVAVLNMIKELEPIDIPSKT